MSHLERNLKSLFQNSLNCSPRGDIPSNLCKRCLHKLLIRKAPSKFCHIPQISHRVAGGVRKRNFNVGGKIFNKFVAPCLVLIDDITDRVVENQQLSIDADHRAVLHRADLLFDRFNDVQIFVGIHQHFLFLHGESVFGVT